MRAAVNSPAEVRLPNSDVTPVESKRRGRPPTKSRESKERADSKRRSASVNPLNGKRARLTEEV